MPRKLPVKSEQAKDGNRPKQTSGYSCYDLKEQGHLRYKGRDPLKPMLAFCFRITPHLPDNIRNSENHLLA